MYKTGSCICNSCSQKYPKVCPKAVNRRPKAFENRFLGWFKKTIEMRSMFSVIYVCPNGSDWRSTLCFCCFLCFVVVVYVFELLNPVWAHNGVIGASRDKKEVQNAAPGPDLRHLFWWSTTVVLCRFWDRCGIYLWKYITLLKITYLKRILYRIL